MKKRIYLAGPIAGLSYDQATNGWRQKFAEALMLQVGDDIECMSPMRGKTFLARQQLIGNSVEEHEGYGQAIAAPAGIVTRDRNDVLTCDAMVACFLEHTCSSLGTAIEFGWADAYRKPIVMVVSPTDRLHNHAMLRQMAGYVVPDLEAAAEIVVHLLLP